MAIPNSTSLLDTTEQGPDLTLLELFFDLVFAFAVSQLSQHLATHLSWRGAAETLVMLLAILTVWSYTSWAATIIRAASSQTGAMLLAVMLLGLFMNASVTRAFTTSGWMFIVPLLTVQWGRTVWTIVNSADEMNRQHYIRVLIWFSATSPLWIVGAAVRPEARVCWWAPAAGMELLGTWFAHPVPGRRLQSENIDFDAEHLLERCRMFLIIALGETVLMTGSAISAAPLGLMTLLTGTFALLGTVALWGLSFGHTHTLILQHLEETSNPIRASRHAINVLMILVTGLIAVAVANKMVIANPQGPATAALSLLLFGGPILFLLAQSWYLRIVLRVSPQVPLIGSVALLIGGIFTSTAPAYMALILASVGLTGLVIFGQGAMAYIQNQEEVSNKP